MRPPFSVRQKLRPYPALAWERPRLPLGSRGAGPKGLRGFERRKFRSTPKIRTILVGAGLCSARWAVTNLYGTL